MNIYPTTFSILQQNTYVLKRRWEPKLHKKNERPAKLRGRHFVYDLIEDTSSRPQMKLDLILTSFVEGVGQKGDVVTVKHNYGYNKLLLPGLAVYKTPESLEKYASSDRVDDDEEKHSSPYAERTVNILQRLPFSIVMNKDNPWTIEKWHIRTSFRKMNIYVPEECIELPEQPITGPDLNKEQKEFYVTVTINNLEKARAKFRIHHWSTEVQERLPYVFECWKLPSEPIFGLTDTKHAENAVEK